jgi:hypothetical protein
MNVRPIPSIPPHYAANLQEVKSPFSKAVEFFRPWVTIENSLLTLAILDRSESLSWRQLASNSAVSPLPSGLAAESKDYH